MDTAGDNVPSVAVVWSEVELIPQAGASPKAATGTAPTLEIRMWTDTSGTMTEIDLSANRYGEFRLYKSVSHPATLEFTVRAGQHTKPIDFQKTVQLTHPSYGNQGTPLFEGFVADIEPVESNTIRYRCFDATKRAGEQITILNAPSIVSTAIPRLVYNVFDGDEDYAFERRHDADVEQIIKDLLDDPVADLRTNLAAPPAALGGTAYTAADLADFDLIPQDKVVFESETLRDGLNRMLGFYPAYRMVFSPGYHFRKWRIFKMRDSTAITITLNRFNAGDKSVLEMSLQRSIEDRWTAVTIYGPEKITAATATVGAAELTEGWTAAEQTLLESSGPGAVGNHVGAKWQIADTSKRHMASRLPAEVLVETGGVSLDAAGDYTANLSFARTRSPSLSASWDGGTTWEPCGEIRLDTINGIVYTTYQVVKQNADDSWTLPDDVRLTYAYYDEPLTARFPSGSTYSGTAYDEASMETDPKIYDPMLAVGFEFGTPVTSAARVAEFEKLAENIHEAKKDVLITGTLVILGLDWDFLHLDRRVNLAAVDGDGGAVTTGWESINAFVTDVDYDLSIPGGRTTIQFSTDEGLSADAEALKEILGIRPYQTLVETHHVIRPTYDPRTKTTKLTVFDETTFLHVPVEPIELITDPLGLNRPI